MTLVRERAEAFGSKSRHFRVLHVTEALGAGVGRSMSRLVQLQREAGADPVVLATRRYDTPEDDELHRWFGSDAGLLVQAGAPSRASRSVWLATRLRRLLLEERFDAVHLHSSFAGVIGRTVLRTIPARRRPPVFYSPHGFAFLREDIAPWKRRAVMLVERVLGALGGTLLLVSESELDVARRHVGASTAVLRNGIDLARFAPSTDEHVERPRPLVVMVGRVAYQKAPWRFAAAARRFGSEADFEWLGYGEPEDVATWLGGAPVLVSGALDHEDLIARLREADVVYFPTLWEGMPMALIEAQAAGVPVVASAVDGNRDVIVDGETGILRGDEDGMLEALGELLRDASERKRLAVRARAEAARFSDADRGTRSLQLYGCAGGG